ncbi:MAG: hypothetical protein N2645_17960 [Clostridia bacterium]|nr:hypothetical protein [Clostridia bacterium]
MLFEKGAAGKHVLALKKRTRKKFAFAFLRFIIYGMIGVFAEVCQYSFVKIGRMIPGVEWFFKFQWRVDDKLDLNGIWEVPWYTLYGQCSLWMFPVYGLCALLFLERVYRITKVRRYNWIIRGICYSITITLFEIVSGFILWGITGYKIWYYSDVANLFNMTSLFLLFVWFVTGLFVEIVYKELLESSLRNRSLEIIEKTVEDVLSIK